MANENLLPATVMRVMREVKAIVTAPADDIRVIVDESRLSELRAIIQGPGACARACVYVCVRARACLCVCV